MIEIPSSVQDFPLNEESHIFIVGSYCGKHAKYYVDTYDSYMYLFEPQREFTEHLLGMFKGNDKVAIFDFGLSDTNAIVEFMQAGGDSCSYIPHKIIDSKLDYGPYITGEIREIGGVMDELGLKEVDLCLMNCEGSEYVILPHLIETGLIERIKYFMVQFHPWKKGYDDLEDILKAMNRTHNKRDDYRPMWITWVRKDE